MATAKRTAITQEEFHRLPEDADVELVDGSLVSRTSPLAQHARLQGYLTYTLATALGEDSRAFLGTECDFPTVRGNIRRGDVVYVDEQHLYVIGEDGRFGGPPTLVAEVVSPGGERTDYHEKRLEYAEAGIRHYWVLGLAGRTVDLYRLGDPGYELEAHLEGDDHLTSPLFPRLDVPLSRLFRWP